MLAAALSSCAAVNTFVVLLPEAGGGPASVVVGDGPQTAILQAPFSAAAVDTAGRIAPRSSTEDEVKRLFAHALAAQPPASVSYLLYFETNSTNVAAASVSAFNALMAEVAKRPAVEVQVTGHTDRVGSDAENDKLSLQRAEAVRAMLIQRGIQASFIRAVGRGEREPLVPTPDGQAEERNRRVEVIVR
jgi:outer membrane protein OmpA-like peptidoglycan-associated protein